METVYTHSRMSITEVPFREDGKHLIVKQGTGMGVVAIPVSRHRGMVSIGLVSQYRPPVGLDSLELPRGGSKDLSAEEAVRELAEELGVVPTGTRFLGVIHPDTGLLSTEVAVYACIVDHDDVEAAAEHIDAESGGVPQWMTPGQFLGAVTGGRIQCSITMAAFLLGRESGLLTSEL